MTSELESGERLCVEMSRMEWVVSRLATRSMRGWRVGK